MAWQELRAACEQVIRGEFVGVQARPDHEAAPESAELAWTLALQALLHRQLGKRPVSVETLRAFVGASPEARLGALWAAGECLRSAALEFDRAELRRCYVVLSRLVTEDPEARCHLQAAQLWLAYAEGQWAQASQLAGPLEAEASALGLARLVVEAAALRAWCLAANGELAEATRVGRRASRMARTEAIPQAEYLAHLVLARIRRLAGSPHLATRILGSLRKVAPPPWWGWLAWESVLAGNLEAAQGLPAGHPAVVLTAWLTALERGERALHLEQSTRLLAASDWPALVEEAEAWTAAVDPARPAPPALADWCGGRSVQTPPILQGLLGWRGVAPASDTAVAYALADGALRRRVPRLSYGLIDRPRVWTGAQTRLKQGRTEMLAAALALAPGAGIAETECFQSVYGFAYEPEVHKGIFDVLLHRVREFFGDRATLTRAKGSLQLQLQTPHLIADPRCTRPLGDSLLGLLAEGTGASAKDVAQATGMSLRVVQATLQSLVKDGACQQERGGREVRYLVEDTTFSEPTQRAPLNWEASTPGSGG